MAVICQVQACSVRYQIQLAGKTAAPDESHVHSLTPAAEAATLWTSRALCVMLLVLCLTCEHKVPGFCSRNLQWLAVADARSSSLLLAKAVLALRCVHHLQVAIGSNLLESSDTFSQLAHNHSSLYGYNTVPGNAYTMITPLLAQAGDSSASGTLRAIDCLPHASCWIFLSQQASIASHLCTLA